VGKLLKNYGIFTENFTREEYFKLNNKDKARLFNEQFKTNLNEHEVRELATNYNIGSVYENRYKYRFKE